MTDEEIEEYRKRLNDLTAKCSDILTGKIKIKRGPKKTIKRITEKTIKCSTEKKNNK